MTRGPQIFATTRSGKPVAMIFVDGEFGRPKFDRLVCVHRRGYAAYRSDETAPFLVARDLRDAIGGAP